MSREILLLLRECAYLESSRLARVCSLETREEMTDPLQLSSAHEDDGTEQEAPVSEGTVASLHIAPAAHVPMTAIISAHLTPGRGIVGDRFYLRRGTDAAYDRTTCDVTLVEQEAVEAMHQQNPLADLGASARRNIVVRDCSLAQLVGRTFRIGNVTLRGLTPRKKDEAFSEPSGNVVPPFMRAERGQQAASCRMIPPQAHLRAEVLTEGTLCVGDRVVLIQEV